MASRFTKFLRKERSKEDDHGKGETSSFFDVIRRKKNVNEKLDEGQKMKTTELYDKSKDPDNGGKIEKEKSQKNEKDRKNKKTSFCNRCLCCCCICTKRKCLFLISCFVLNACNSFIVDIIDSGNPGFGYEKDWGKTQTRQVQMSFNGIRLLATWFGVLLSLKTNCRVMSIGGCVLIACSLFITSWLNKRLIGIIGFLVGGVAGFGSSFIKLASIVPILEHFSVCRFMAVAFVNIGGICGDIVYFIVVEFGWVTDDSNTHWKNMYRGQLVVMGVAFLASLGLRPSTKKWIDEYFSPFDWKIFKRKTLYCLIIAFFFSQFGHYPLSRRMTLLFEKKVLSAFGVLMYYAGQILGPTFLFCCIKKKMLPSLFVMAPLSLVAGVWTFVTVFTMANTELSIYGGVLGITKAAFETLLQNGIPTAFGIKHVRLVTGLLDFGAGIGVLISDPASVAAEDNYGGDEHYKATFYLSGVMLILSAIFIAICIFVIRKYEPLKPEKEMTSSDIEDDDDVESDENENNTGGKTRKKRLKSKSQSTELRTEV